MQSSRSLDVISAINHLLTRFVQLECGPANDGKQWTHKLAQKAEKLAHCNALCPIISA